MFALYLQYKVIQSKHNMKNKTLAIRLTEEDKKLIETLAEKTDFSVSEFVARLINVVKDDKETLSKLRKPLEL